MQRCEGVANTAARFDSQDRMINRNCYFQKFTIVSLKVNSKSGMIRLPALWEYCGTWIGLEANQICRGTIKFGSLEQKCRGIQQGRYR
jgi:hypothetical protein